MQDHAGHHSVVVLGERDLGIDHLREELRFRFGKDGRRDRCRSTIRDQESRITDRLAFDIVRCIRPRFSGS